MRADREDRGAREDDCFRCMQTINREHPEYIARKAMWKQYKDLYAGGEQLRERASEYLVRRHKEPSEVYQERLSRVFYENYIGSIIDWYAATLMRREPALLLEGNDAAAKKFYSAAGGRLRPEGHQPERVLPAAIRGGAGMREQLRGGGFSAGERGGADAGGRRCAREQSRAYLVDYGADEVINWNYDQTGGLDWVVIRTSCLQQSKVTDAKWERETRWIYYDRENFQIFRKAGEAQRDRTGRRRAARAGGAAPGAGVPDEGDRRGCG